MFYSAKKKLASERRIHEALIRMLPLPARERKQKALSLQRGEAYAYSSTLLSHKETVAVCKTLLNSLIIYDELSFNELAEVMTSVEYREFVSPQDHRKWHAALVRTLAPLSEMGKYKVLEEACDLCLEPETIRYVLSRILNGDVVRPVRDLLQQISFDYKEYRKYRIVGDEVKETLKQLLQMTIQLESDHKTTIHTAE